MQRILMAFAIVLLLAGLAFAAECTWTNATEDDDWTTAGNWDGGVPTPGTDVAVFDGVSEGARGLPTVNLLDLSVVNQTFWFTADYSTTDISEFTSDGGGSCAASLFLVGAGTGKIRLDNAFDDAEAYNGTLIVKTGTTVTGDIGLWGNGKVEAEGAGAVIDGWILSPVGSTDGGIVDWGSGNLTVNGGVDAWVIVVLRAFTHQNTAGATLTCDQTGEIALGGAATGLAVVIDGAGQTVTCRADESVASLTVTAGTLAGNSK
ncbi:MAG TPA: hypothetical protein VMY35_14560, partial [Phycisphaerae bacterium]|nr:hypothetical protein [Phycisphaerae bacterium]